MALIIITNHTYALIQRLDVTFVRHIDQQLHLEHVVHLCPEPHLGMLIGPSSDMAMQTAFDAENEAFIGSWFGNCQVNKVPESFVNAVKAILFCAFLKPFELNGH